MTSHHTPARSDHPIAAAVRLVNHTLDGVIESPTWSLDTTEVTHLATTLAAATARLAELEARVLTHGESIDVAATIGARNTAAWLAWHTHLTRTEAHRKIRAAHQLGRHDPTRAALARGEIHLEQATCIAAAVDELEATDQRELAEKHLIGEAHHHDAKALRVLGRRILEIVDPARADEHEARLLEQQEARGRAKTRLSMSDDGQGLTRGSFAIPTHNAAMLRKLLAALAAPKHVRATQGAGTYDHERPTPAKLGQAFCELIENYPVDRTPSMGGVNATVVVTVDISVLLGAYQAAHLDTGEAISPGLVRRWACQAGIIPAVMDGPSVVLDLARQCRFHTRAQRIAIGIEQKHCQHPSCDVPAAFCHVHHTIPWSKGGPTDTKHAALLCPFHHHRAHAENVSYPCRT